MITVAILINGRVLFVRNAVRAETAPLREKSTYVVGDYGKPRITVQHKVGDGAIKLAKKLLDTIPKEERVAARVADNSPATFFRNRPSIK